MLGELDTPGAPGSLAAPALAAALVRFVIGRLVGPLRGIVETLLVRLSLIESKRELVFFERSACFFFENARRNDAICFRRSSIVVSLDWIVLPLTGIDERKVEAAKNPRELLGRQSNDPLPGFGGRPGEGAAFEALRQEHEPRAVP